MSSDNFFLVRWDGSFFVVTMEFASDDCPSPLRKDEDGEYVGGCTRIFADHAEAVGYAHSDYTEYGVVDISSWNTVERLKYELHCWQSYYRNVRLARADEEEQVAALEAEVAKLKGWLSKADREFGDDC